MGGSASGGLATGLVSTTLGAVELIDSTTGQPTGVADGGPDVVTGGNGEGERLPFATQGLCRLRTNTFFGGRELRGRLYIPGLTEDHSDAGVPNANFKTKVQDALTLLGESALAVYSPTKHQWATVGATSVWSQWAVLRSRRD
jgi:hypothetical protein